MSDNGRQKSKKEIDFEVINNTLSHWKEWKVENRALEFKSYLWPQDTLAGYTPSKNITKSGFIFLEESSAQKSSWTLIGYPKIPSK